jgi:tetratricopeptide (TPR) repeat protein
MQIPKLTFPHIPRLFSALTFILWVLLLAAFIFNIQGVIQKPSFLSDFFTPSLSHPFSAKTHLSAAVNLWNSGFHQTAKNEILLAQDLFRTQDQSVLGIATSPSVLLAQWEAQPQKLMNDYEYWTSVAEERPDYRDGYIMAGFCAYQLNKQEEALTYFKKAQEIDPNYQPLNTILEKIEK